MSRRRKPAPPTSLDGPLPGATVSQAFARFWQRTLWFTGRASRSEFWWAAVVWLFIASLFELFGLILAGSYTAYLDAPAFGLVALPGNLWALATLVPSLSLSARRLQDTNRPGWWLVLLIVPLFGWVALIIFCASRSNPAGARFDRRYA